MGRPRGFTKSELERSIQVAKSSGLTISEIIIENGKARLMFGGTSEQVKELRTGEPKGWDDYE
ncbi:hypothetical protein ABEB22_15265 (plasmid) [Thioclava sp. 'Guangxiensis']|uniref:hypothetical protein n=1 Tax=Thioclava sp. 'Guangxiensis' TaxID=3149044 RepID=UPI0032C45094